MRADHVVTQKLSIGPLSKNNVPRRKMPNCPWLKALCSSSAELESVLAHNRLFLGIIQGIQNLRKEVFFTSHAAFRQRGLSIPPCSSEVFGVLCARLIFSCVCASLVCQTVRERYPRTESTHTDHDRVPQSIVWASNS